MQKLQLRGNCHTVLGALLLGRLAGIRRRERGAQPLVELRSRFPAVSSAPGDRSRLVVGAGRAHQAGATSGARRASMFAAARSSSGLRPAVPSFDAHLEALETSHDR